MPRPRDPEIDRVVCDAVLALLAEGGYARATIDAVAARAGIQRPAIYRRFPNRAAMVAEAARAFGRDAIAPTPETRDVRADLTRAVGDLVTLLTTTPYGGIVRALAAGVREEETAEAAEALRAVEQARRRALRAVLRRAARAKLLRVGIDEELALDALLGPIYLRFLLTEKRPSPAQVRGQAKRLVELVLRR